MDVLVDYNNLPRAVLMRGPRLVIDRIVTTLAPHLTDMGRVNVRLYDGWYQEQGLTRRAQDVSAEVSVNFPTTQVVLDGSATKKVLVNVEVAYSMMIDPASPMWHTYRMKSAPRNLSCVDPAAAGCSVTPCDLAYTHQFFRDKKCPNAGCSMSPTNMINRGEQKLVDGMLAADLYFLHLRKDTSVAVVSSDDDMWPAIRTVLDLGVHVLHVHPLPGHRTPAYYSRGRKPKYTELDL